jgi:hypothetical protein
MGTRKQGTHHKGYFSLLAALTGEDSTTEPYTTASSGLMDLHSSLPLKKSENRVCISGCTMVSRDRDTSSVPPPRSKMRMFFSPVAPFLSRSYTIAGVGS